MRTRSASCTVRQRPSPEARWVARAGVLAPLVVAIGCGGGDAKVAGDAMADAPDRADATADFWPDSALPDAAGGKPHGRVKTLGGAPVAGATVTSFDRSLTATTDADGEFRWPTRGPSPGEVVRVEAVGHWSLLRKLPAGPGTTDLSLLPNVRADQLASAVGVNPAADEGAYAIQLRTPSQAGGERFAISPPPRARFVLQTSLRSADTRDLALEEGDAVVGGLGLRPGTARASLEGVSGWTDCSVDWPNAPIEPRTLTVSDGTCGDARPRTHAPILVNLAVAGCAGAATAFDGDVAAWPEPCVFSGFRPIGVESARLRTADGRPLRVLLDVRRQPTAVVVRGFDRGLIEDALAAAPAPIDWNLGVIVVVTRTDTVVGVDRAAIRGPVEFRDFDETTHYFANVAPGRVGLRLDGCVSPLDGYAFDVEAGTTTLVQATTCTPDPE